MTEKIRSKDWPKPAGGTPDEDLSRRELVAKVRRLRAEVVRLTKDNRALQCDNARLRGWRRQK